MEEYLGSVVEGNFHYCIAGFVLVTITVASWWLKQFSTSQLRLEPPGPRGIPFLGQLPFAGKNLFSVKCMEWAKTYGPVFRIQLGAAKIVVLNDYESVKKYFVQKEIQYRPEDLFFQTGGIKGLGTMNGPAWTDNRSFCVNVLRDRGVGNENVVKEVAKEVQYLTEKLLSHHGNPTSFREYVMASVSNNMTMFLFGVRYSFEDHRRTFLDQNVIRLTEIKERGSYIDILPDGLKRLARMLPLAGRAAANESLRNLIDFASQEVREHEKTMDKQKCRDFIDDYLKKIEENKNDPNSHFKHEYLVGHILEFLFAGTVGVAVTIHWHMLNCAHNTESLQKVIQSEIDRVVGSERQPEWEDHHKMPFTMATIWEMYRCKPITNFPRGAANDTFFDKYFISKKTIVIRNGWAVHMNPEVWKNPMTFDPTRFLNRDGTELVSKPKHLIPFSLGKRMCPGENFSTMQIFLYLTTVLQKFRVLPEDGETFSFPFYGERKAELLRQKLAFVRR